MSTSRHIYVTCDGDPGCDEMVHLRGRTHEVTESRVRTMAASSGWQFTKGCDLCPRHRTDTLLNVLDPA